MVLKGLSLSIKPGEKVGVVGRTGAGKSTVCLGLCRIIEAAGGSIQIDGYDISLVELERLRQSITIIPQDAVIFDGTLKFNLDPTGQCTEDEMMRLVREASLEKLVMRDPNGLEQKIETGGQNLASGEK